MVNYFMVLHSSYDYRKVYINAVDVTRVIELPHGTAVATVDGDLTTVKESSDDVISKILEVLNG